MDICILGGTGDMGRGLALRWARKHQVLIGSRSRERAEKAAEGLRRLSEGFYQEEFEGGFRGLTNAEAVEQAEVVVVCFPPKAVGESLQALKPHLRGEQVVVSTVVPMRRRKGLFEFASFGGEASAAELVQRIVKPLPVVTAMQTVPAAYLRNVDAVLNLDVLVAGDDEPSKALVSSLIRDIPNLRPLDVGPLGNSRFIEALTPLLLNAAVLNGLEDPSIRVVPWIPREV